MSGYDTIDIRAPLFFERNRVFRVYRGGLLFHDFFGDPAEDDFYPEEWVASTVKALNREPKSKHEGISLVAGSRVPFSDVVQRHQRELVGDGSRRVPSTAAWFEANGERSVRVRSMKVMRPGSIVLEEREVPACGPGEVLIKVMACGICGTDVHIYRGEYLGGYPVVPGHEFSGVVEAVGSGVTRYRPGDRVAVEPNVACDDCESCLNNRQNFCRNWQGIGVTRPGGFAQYAIAPERAVFSIGNLGFEEGAFMEPLSCVLHGLERARVPAGAKIAVLGAGPIGILLLESALALGAADATVAEKNPARLAFARACGAKAAVLSLDELEKDAYDLVIDATGSPAVMARTIDFARPGGTVLLFGVPPKGATMEIEPFVIFSKGLTVLSSYTSVRNSYQALRLMREGRVAVPKLVSHRLPLEEFRRGIELIETGADDVKKVLLLPNGALP